MKMNKQATLLASHADALIESKRKKKKNSHCSSITYTTGDIGYNIRQFNKRMGTDFDDVESSEAKAQKAAEAAAKALGTIAAPSPDGGSSIDLSAVGNDASGSDAGGESVGSAAVAENFELTEAKRYVRRYYIRPQNVFCSNKTDIINALIEFEDQDCVIYTLNNLGDVKDVTKLTNNDVIYYYEDYVLYDKNHVRIMDYDLYIKHEEQRKKINIDTVSDKVFKDVYEDRLTGTSDVDEALNLDFVDVNAYGEKLVEGKEIDGVCCICGEDIVGYGNNAEPYAKGRCCDACNVKFVIPARLEAAIDAEREEE